MAHFTTLSQDVSSPPGTRVREVSVNTDPLAVTREYSVPTDSFLADGGDGYPMFAAAKNRIDRQIPVRDILLTALKRGPLKASVRDRIRHKTPPPAH